MMLNRRRFLVISAIAAGAAGIGVRTNPVRWNGLALGADVSIEINGAGQADAMPALQAAIDTIYRMEKLFSLYDPESALSLLNRNGFIEAGPEFIRLIGMATEAHRLTGGLFDPTVQSLFMAKLQGRLPDREDYSRVGWNMVHTDGFRVWFDQPGMAITLNGIAQGFATDRVSEVLSAHGFTATLVNIGEYRAGKQAAEIGVATPDGGLATRVTLQQSAVATSYSNGYRFKDGTSHIFPTRPEIRSNRWTAATVTASEATLADAFSTALILAPDLELARSLVKTSAREVMLQDVGGQIWQV